MTPQPFLLGVRITPSQTGARLTSTGVGWRVWVQNRREVHG
jgi:hypothetical protein